MEVYVTIPVGTTVLVGGEPLVLEQDFQFQAPPTSTFQKVGEERCQSFLNDFCRKVQGDLMPEVIVYSKAGCPGCVSAKAHLKRLGIPFEERRVDELSEYRAEVLALGARSVPVIVAGFDHIVGYDAEKLVSLLMRAELIK